MMAPDRVPSKLDQRLLGWCGHPLMVVGIWFLLILASADKKIKQAGFFSGHVLDTDSFMHLTRHLAGDWWRSGGWTDRINAPFGAVVHWTYPYDIFLAVIAAPIRLFVPAPISALAIAGAWSSALATLIAMLILHDFGTRLRHRIAGTVLALLYLSALPVLSYSSLGRADHHSLTLLMAVIFLTALARAATEQKYRFLILAGVAGGIGIWTAPEILPALGAGIGLFLGWHIALGRPIRHQDALIGGILGLTCLIGLLLDPPYDGLWSPDSDRLSIVFVVFGGLVTLTLIGIAQLNHFCDRPWARIVLTAAIGAIAGIIWLGLFPHALSGPIGHVTPLLQQKWLKFISEMQPIHNPVRFFWYLTPGMIGLGAAIWLAVHWRHTAPAKSLFMGMVSGIIVLSIVGGALAARFCYFAVLAGIVPMVIWWCDHGPRWWILRFYLLLGIIALPLMIGIQINNIAGLIGHTDWNELAPKATEYCRSLDPIKSFLPSEKITFMAPQNLGPRILWETPHKIVGAPFHRNEQGILDEIAFYQSDDPAIITHIAQSRHLDMALVCQPTSGIIRMGWIQKVALGQITTPEWRIIGTVTTDNGKTHMTLLRFRPE